MEFMFQWCQLFGCVQVGMASCFIVIMLYSYLAGWLGKKENISYFMVSSWNHPYYKAGMFWNKSISPSVRFPSPCSVHYHYTKFAKRRFILKCSHEYHYNSSPWYSSCNFSLVYSRHLRWVLHVHPFWFFASVCL